MSSLKKIVSCTPILIAILSAFFVYWLLGIYGKAELKRESIAVLKSINRMAYWKLNGVGDTKFRDTLGFLQTHEEHETTTFLLWDITT